METSQATTAVVLDSRYIKKDGTYPLKLRVVFSRSPRMYAITLKLSDGTVIDSLTPGDLDKAKGRKPEKDATFTFKNKDTYKVISQLISDKEKEAIEIIKKLDPFEFDKFRDTFLKKKQESEGEPENVFWQYDVTIKMLQKHNQLGTASNYDLSCKSLKAFIKFNNKTENEPKKLVFKYVTADFLQKYEDFMYAEMKKDDKITKSAKSPTTVSMYLRALRTLFNMAIYTKTIEPEVYPFRRSASDKNKYEIPTGHKVKKALSKEELKDLFNAKAKTPEQEKARDFWFFSYTCNGMNVKDICLLRNENIETESLNFYRAKTKTTNKDQRPVIALLTDFAKSVIEKYRNPDTNPKAFVFQILKLSDNEEAKRREIHAFTRFINQHIKLLAGSVGITTEISTYFARHSFATQAIQNGASFELVGDALSHSDIRSTKGYFAGFADNTKKALMEGLMKF